ncbi:FHA domain-containing protein [Microbacterium album]|uniref:FHA domain-containing protein n=1 Tax=Microbacterium album TaxID=2053191 RepID=A0A917II28_9MICO|nr:FHA domain-containing protein [Microbacterium album]GGH50902.1 hypothetical protein GCM10010921_29970 [Microbacterium album]
MRVTYEPGGMLAIVAETGIAVLENGLPQDRIDDVWQALDDGEGVEAVIDAVRQAFGDSETPPPFAVAVAEGEDVRAAVRGDLRLEIETISGSVVLSDEGGSDPTGRRFEDALSVLVRPAAAAPATTSELPIASGAVLARSVRAVFFEVDPADADHVPGDTLLPDDAGEGDDAFAETIVVPPRRTRGEHAADSAARDDALGGSEEEPQGDHDGATISAAQLAAARAGDHDGATIAVAHEPAIWAPESPAAPPRTYGRIRLSTGEVAELDRPVVIGRRPRSSRTTGAELPRLLAVESPQNDISRNHVEISSDGHTVVVTDLHTTNGTTLLRGGADPVRLHPGEQTVVVTGDVIDLGDDVTVAFEELP